MSSVSGYKPQGGMKESSPGGNNGLGRQPDLKDQAKGLGQDIKNKASDLTETVTSAVKEQASGLRAAAEGFASDATEKVTSAMVAQKSASADYISGIAHAVQRAAGEFERDLPQAAQYIRKASDQIETFAGVVRERDARELLSEVQDFARRQPAMFFGGALLLGFAALRFLKSSEPRSSARSFEASSSSQGGRAFEARRQGA